ncbi:MAG: sigma-54-dependent Fis family transcriptional regulator [Desulfobacterales bacterium]
MKKDTKILKPIVIGRRLAELKHRLRQVAEAWTVDDYESYLDFYVHILPRIMDAERCTIYIIEMGTEKICSMFGTGIQKMQIQPPRKGSIAGEVISTGKGIIKNDMEQSEGFHTRVDAKTGFITQNSVCHPIKSLTGHGVTGAIQLLNRNSGPFMAEDLALLEEIADYLSTSIESIMLNQEILRISDQLNREYERRGRGFFLDTPFVAESAAIQEALSLVESVSNTPVSVLIQGENGTGKELIARMIHESSDRQDGPFVAVNCSAIPENLMESEFFGYEKGAFTGAEGQRKGRFEEAKAGTLFLDEIADMPPSIQPKFLRAIQESEGSRLGSNDVIAYDFRLLCASNKDLRTQLEKGAFREDLFFRLFSVEIRVPPLRDRAEDIIPMSTTFLEDICRLFDKKIAGFSPGVLKLFETYRWPGNVRQLRHEIERLVALTPPGETIKPDKCSPELLGTDTQRHDPELHLDSTLPNQVRDLEIRLIGSALKKTDGNRARAAKVLGITRQGLYKKLKRYEIA